MALRRSATLAGRLHAALIRLSGGRLRRSYAFAGGLSVLVLTTTGRRTRRPRSTPLAYLREGEAFAVLAANAGAQRAPAWWLNLKADPRAEVELDGRRISVRGRRAPPDTDAALWSRFTKLNPGFAEYRRLAPRQIPVVLLEPVHEGAQASGRRGNA